MPSEGDIGPTPFLSWRNNHELRRAVVCRADALAELTDTLRGQLAASRGSLHAALELAGMVPESLRNAVGILAANAGQPDLEMQTLASLLRHLNIVLDFVETHLSHGTRRELSEALADEVRDELNELGVGLIAGVPGCEIGGGSYAAPGITNVLSRADAVNAAWLARVEGAVTPFDRLAEKTLESTDFVRSWLANGGIIPPEIHQRGHSCLTCS